MKMDVEQFDMPRYLSLMPLFSALTQLERERLAQSCQLRRLARGDMAFRVGEECDPRFSMHMLAGISRRLHGLVRDVEGDALHSGMQRLIGYLLRDLQDEDTVSTGVITVSLPVRKATIASRLSLTPEYFSRVLQELEAENLIEIDKREIRILDAQRLASYGSH